MVELSISPTASGKLNVTIARNLRYVGGRLNWTNAVVTDTYVTVTAVKTLKVSLSQSPVYQGQSFTVTVTTGVGVSVSGADVEFAGTTVQTGSDGKASFTAPDPGVESVVYTITVEKTGFVSEDKSITVIKVYDITLVGPDAAPSTGESFTVTVLAKGQPLAGATVTFNGKTVMSGGDGKVSLTAPSSPGDYPVSASFPNYGDASLTLKVGDGGVPGFEVLSVLVALGVAFIVLRRRR
jgi:PGF-CTERM protein